MQKHQRADAVTPKSGSLTGLLHQRDASYRSIEFYTHGFVCLDVLGAMIAIGYSRINM